MITRRVDSGGFEIVRANPQVLLTTPEGSFLAGTFQLLTRGGVFEEPLSSKAMEGNGWDGSIVDVPIVSLPGTVEPFVWIKPTGAISVIRQECLELVWDAGGDMTINIPATLKPRWEVAGASRDHSYSLRPTLLLKGCSRAKFTPTTPGALPDREDEGSLAIYPGEDGIEMYGIVVDIDTDIRKGFAVPLNSVITPSVLETLRL